MRVRNKILVPEMCEDKHARPPRKHARGQNGSEFDSSRGRPDIEPIGKPLGEGEVASDHRQLFSDSLAPLLQLIIKFDAAAVDLHQTIELRRHNRIGPGDKGAESRGGRMSRSDQRERRFRVRGACVPGVRRQFLEQGQQLIDVRVHRLGRGLVGLKSIGGKVQRLDARSQKTLLRGEARNRGIGGLELRVQRGFRRIDSILKCGDLIGKPLR